MASELKIQGLDRSWADAVSSLRVNEYQRFGKDLVAVKALQWGPSDDRFLNLGVIRHGQLLSVLRLEIHHSQETLDTYLQTPATPQRFPAAVLSRAATVATAAQEFPPPRSLHMLLRLCALETLSALNIQDVYGTFKESTRRTEFMRSLGYTFEKRESTWNDFLRSDEPIYLAHLDLSLQGANAIALLKNVLGPMAEATATERELLVAQCRSRLVV